MGSEAMKKTPFFDELSKCGGKIVEFAGYALPMQFKGILNEHEAVRERAGLFDVSHMGEVTVKGKEAEDYVSYIVTNDVKALKNNEVMYTFMCNPNGGVVDDLLVYKYSNEYYYLVVNASNKDKDFKWMVDNSKKHDVELVDISESVAQLALQGPMAQKTLQKLTDLNLEEIRFFNFRDEVSISNCKCLVSRTGYTGEDGFEIYCRPEDGALIFREILKAGEEFGVEPCGLGARDTLRFEATLPLYGNEMDATISPLEMGFGFFVKLNKEGDFIGKDALVKQKAEGVTRKLVGFELLDKGVARHGYEVFIGDEEIGHVTTGYKSPTLNKTIGLALVKEKYSKLGTEIYIKVRNKKLKALVINKKFYNKKTASK